VIEDPSALTDEGAERPAPRPLTSGHQALAFVKELLGVLVGALVVASLLRACVGQMFLIPSGSMEQTLRIDDRVVVEKLGRLQRGEVVVFANPGGWLSGPAAPERGAVGRALEFVGVLPDPSTEHLVKRLVGLPGDRVECCDADGRLRVNGHPLDETSYLDTGAAGVQALPSTLRFDVVVPQKRIFVLGDNREHSRDSRCHLNDIRAGLVRGGNAFVPEDLVVGRAVAVAWPVSHARLLGIPATFDPARLDRDAAAPAAPLTPTIHAGPEATC
jgi:signal peptidase I